MVHRHRSKMFNITTIVETDVAGVTIIHDIAMAIGTTGRTTGIGGHHHAIGITHRVIALPRYIAAVAMRMYAGAITVIGHIGLTTIRSSPITAHVASAIRPIFKACLPNGDTDFGMNTCNKIIKPRKSGAFS